MGSGVAKQQLTRVGMYEHCLFNPSEKPQKQQKIALTILNNKYTKMPNYILWT